MTTNNPQTSPIVEAAEAKRKRVGDALMALELNQHVAVLDYIDLRTVEGRLDQLVNLVPNARAAVTKLKDDLADVDANMKRVEATIVAMGIEGSNETQRRANLQIALDRDEAYQALVITRRDVDGRLLNAEVEAEARDNEWKLLRAKHAAKVATIEFLAR